MLLADGTTTVNAGQDITATELQGLKFKPAADANGNTSFSFSVTDSGSADGREGPGGYAAELSDIELIRREISQGTDLSADGTTGATITSKLNNPAPGTTTPTPLLLACCSLPTVHS